MRLGRDAKNTVFFSLASHACEARALRTCKTLTPRYFLTDFEKKPTVLQSAIEPITVDGKTTTDAGGTIANGFCTYFTNVVEKLLSSIPPLNRNQLSTEACLNNSSQSMFSSEPVSAAFVHRQLRLLKTSKGTGP